MMTFTWNERAAPSTGEVGSSPVFVFVVSTGPELLNSSLEAARQYTRGLGAQIEVLAPYVVPYPLDLSHPPVEPSFLENKLLSQHALLPEAEKVRILLCRNEAEAVLGTLPPKSIVVMAAKRRWWKTREDCLIAALRNAGHQVMVAETPTKRPFPRRDGNGTVARS